MSYERQAKLSLPTSNARVFLLTVFQLFQQNHRNGRPVRSLSVWALGLVPINPRLSLFEEEQARQKEYDL